MATTTGTPKVALALLGIVGVGLLVASCGPTTSDPAAPARPRSAVLIVVDTLRADHMGAYGYGRDTTPALDAWAARGARFERAFAASPWTLPSLATILTGRHAAEHGAGIRLGSKTGRRFAALAASVQTLPERLAARGFATGAVVNHLFLHTHFGLTRGFGEVDFRASTNERVRRSAVAVDDALRWLDAQPTAPFFLLLHLFDPHAGYDPPASSRGRFTSGYAGAFEVPVAVNGGLRLGLVQPGDADRAFIVGTYDEELFAVDRALGRFLDALETRGHLDHTLVMLTADHGEEFYEHDRFEHGHSLYQELLHVPLLVWGPGVKAGSRAAPVSHVDLAPTLLDALDIPSDGLSGRSLWPALTSGTPPPPADLLAANILYGRQRRTLVRWPWKLVTDDLREDVKLFDLGSDPGERHDRSSERPGVAAELLAALATHPRLDEAAADARPAVLDDDTREKLRSLGYVE